MTRDEKLLALDAALTASADVIPTLIRVEIREWLTSELRQNFWIGENQEAEGDIDFGCFLDAQKDAVKKLVNSEEVFGVQDEDDKPVDGYRELSS